MEIIDDIQGGLSRLQAIPIVGPVVFSPIKATVSQAQIISGFALGIFSGMAATSMAVVNERHLARRLTNISISGFAYAVKGFASLFYACANIATLGLLGICVELSRRDVVVIHAGHHHHHSCSRPFGRLPF